MKTISKLLIIIGTFIVFVADSYALWNFFGSFNAMKSSEASGIGAFATAIDSAYQGVLLSFVGIFFLFIGCILLLIPARAKN
jgi:amino acid transporter